MKQKLIRAFALSLLVPSLVLAAEFRMGEQVSLGLGEQVFNDDLYLMGGSVTSAGVVEGDVIAGGGGILISGNVKGDVLAGGGNITILSEVGDDIRMGGGTLLLQSRVGGDVILGGGQITLGGPGVGGDVAIGGGVVRIDAPVAGEVRIGGGNVYLNAPINGDIFIEADSLTLGGNAVILGTLTYRAAKEFTKENGAVVNGRVDFQPRKTKHISEGALKALFSIFALGKFLMLLLCSLVISLGFKRYSKKLIEKADANMPFLLGKGLVVFAATPVIIVLLFITLVGIPLGVIGLLGFVILLLATWIVSPLLTGSLFYKYVLKKDAEVTWQTVTVGAVVFSLLTIIPIVGWVVQCLILVLTLGAMFEIKWEVVKEWR